MVPALQPFVAVASVLLRFVLLFYPNQALVKLTLTPCMTIEDLKKGLEEAARRMPAAQA